MNMKIERQDDRILIRIAKTGRGEREVEDALRECRQRSSWACPSGECTKIGAVDVRREGESMLIALTPCAGEQISEHAIGECLHYMLGAIGGETTR